MADLSDVENALLATVGAALYQTGQGVSVLGVPGRIYRGWPDSAELDADLRDGVFHVTVYPRPGMERNTTRFPRQQQVMTQAAPTITASLSGQAITFGGAVTTPQNVAVWANGQLFTYAVQTGDTLSTIASALASLINGETPATSSGPVLTLASAADISVNVGAQATVWRELKRQQRQFQITVWCNDPLLRDKLGGTVDAALAAIDFLTLADGTQGWLIYVSSSVNDAPEKELLYRRDLFYSVEYATTEVSQAAQIVAVTAEVEIVPAIAADATSTFTVNI